MGGVHSLIICVKMARSNYLAGSDCGDEYSLNTLQKSAICLCFLPDMSVKRKAIELLGENSVIPLISVFCLKSLACNRKSKNCCFVLCFRHESTEGNTRGSPEKNDFFIISQTHLSLSWLENLVRLCMLPSDKIALKQLPAGTIRELQRVNFTGIQVCVGTLFAFVVCFTT